MIKVLILDFDGVVLESVEVKTEAFRKLFSFSPEHVDEIVSFHIRNGGMSRFDKFRHIYKNILKKPLSDDEFERLVFEFSGLVKQGVIDSRSVAGADTLLSALLGKIPVYIVSATPEDEINGIVKEKNLGIYFEGVYGSPAKKADLIRTIIGLENTIPEDVLFVGDAINDLNAAIETEVRFVGRISSSVPDEFSGRDGVDAVVSDMHGLLDFLAEEGVL